MTSKMESVESHLGRRLTHRLTSHDSDGLARLNERVKIFDLKECLEILFSSYSLDTFLLVFENLVFIFIDILYLRSVSHVDGALKKTIPVGAQDSNSPTCSQHID